MFIDSRCRSESSNVLQLDRLVLGVYTDTRCGVSGQKMGASLSGCLCSSFCASIGRSSSYGTCRVLTVTAFLAVIAVISSSLQVISRLVGDMCTCAACIICAVSKVIIQTGTLCEASFNVSSIMVMVELLFFRGSAVTFTI